MATEDKLREYLKRVTVDLTDARRRIAEADEARHEPIAIVGMACRYPGGDTVEEFWDLLRDGRSGVVEVPPSRWNVDDYYNPDRRVVGGVYTRHGGFLDDIAGWDAEFFGISPQEALRMDPHQRLLMELVWEGLENAGTSPTQLAGSRTGVMVGYMDSVQYGRLETERYGDTVTADPYFGPGVSASVAAGRLAYQFDFRGPTMTLDTACSSSLVGVHLAAQALRRGECDLAVAAGTFLIVHPDTYVLACATSMLSPDGRCKTFDSSADGYVLGEGGGIVVLERLSSALRNNRRIRGVLRGSAVNQDGRSNGLTAPSRSAQVEVIRQALIAAKVEPDDVDFVEAHGSGTHLGDAIELSALHDVFGGRSPQRPLHVGAVKTNIGHTQSAAGVAGLIKTVLSLENGLLPSNLHLNDLAGAVPPDGTIRPAGAAVPFVADGRRTIAGVSSFGWSGTNTHLVVEAPPVPAPTESDVDGPHTLTVSGASPAALRSQLERLSGWLAAHPELALTDVAHTLSVGRAGHDHRRAVAVTDRGDAIRRLADAAASAGVHRAKGRPRVAFLLPGIGDEYAGLGRELYATEPVYAAAVDRCVEIVEQRCGVDLRPAFAAAAVSATDFASLIGRGATAPADDPLHQAELAHPFQFTVEYALATLLAHWGVTPDVVVGYSLGEYVGACLAGVFTLADALYVVVERARLISAAPAGRMVAVAADEQTVRAAITASGAEVDIAALNGPSMTVLSGIAGEITAITARLTESGIACQPLRTAHAFHSSLLEPARGKLAALIDSVPRSAPAIDIVSNRTGATLTAAQATSSDYWAEHLVSAVRFADGVRHCAEQGINVFVELGAGQTLGGLARQNLTGPASGAILGTLPPMWSAGERPDARHELLSTCGRLWELGVDVDWSATRGGRGRTVTLPGYAFQRTRFWPEPGEAAARPAAAARHGEPADICYTPAWRHAVTGALPTALALPGPLVVFADRDGVGTALADLAAASGVSVVEVVAGAELRRDGRRLTIDPTVPEHYREAFAGLDGRGTVHVAHLWSLLTTAQDGTFAGDAELRGSIRDGVGSLLLAIQALGDLPGRPDVRLLTVSAGAGEILGADIPAPHRAGVHGLSRVAQHEYPGLTWTGVDLDPAVIGVATDRPADLATAAGQRAGTPSAGSTTPLVPAAVPRAGIAAAAAQLAYELVGAPVEAHGAVAGWRRGRRWIQDWAIVSTSDEPTPTWRADGVYLITGGTRGLGLGLARHLVRAGVKRLALVSRTPLLDPARDGDPRVVQSRRDVAELEAAGVEVLLLTADVGVGDQLRAALRRCREHFGALHGVVHVAGLPASGMVARGTLGTTETVLAPKVLAMGPLAELVGPGTPAQERPELLVLYSSAITAFGGIGEGDYCAANSVLDAYGAALSATAPSTRVVTVAWGPWLHDDWQVNAAGGSGGGLAERAGDYRRRFGFADEAGCALLDRVVASGHGSVVAVRQPMSEALREWSAMIDIDALVGASSPLPSGERFPRPQLRTEFVAPRSDLETLIAGVWQAYLGIDRVGVHDPFFDLGGNSLVGMAMVHAVEKELDTPIAPAVLFEHPTVAEFAAALKRAETGEDNTQHLLAISSDRGQRRRRAARPGNRK